MGSPVLVAEDEPQLRTLLERVLTRAGYEVVVCSDCAQAVRAIEARADLGAAVLDASIGPEGAGAAVEALAARERSPGFVVTSGDLLGEPLDSLVREHGGVFLRKPFGPRALLRAVAEAAGRPSDPEARAVRSGEEVG